MPEMFSHFCICKEKDKPTSLWLRKLYLQRNRPYKPMERIFTTDANAFLIDSILWHGKLILCFNKYSDEQLSEKRESEKE